MPVCLHWAPEYAGLMGAPCVGGALTERNAGRWQMRRAWKTVGTTLLLVLLVLFVLRFVSC